MMDNINEWLEDIDCEGTLELLSHLKSPIKYYRLKSSMHHGIVADFSLDKKAFSSFIQRNLPLYEAGVHVAKVFTYNRGEGFVFMEDLGSTHLCDVHSGDLELFYDKAIDTIVKMQNSDTEELSIDTAETLLEEMKMMPTYYLEKHLNMSINGELKERLEQIFEIIKNEVLAQPYDVFVHKNYQANNLMFNCNDSLVVTEYQGAKLGAITYDLVTLLRDVHVKLEPKEVERLALSFRDKKALDIDDETFMRWFDFTGMQRHLYLLGLAVKNHAEDGREEHLKSIPLLLDYLKSVASKYDEVKSLDWLERF